MLPIFVAFSEDVRGKAKTVMKVMEVEELDEEAGTAVWRLLDVPENSPGIDPGR